MQWRGLFFNNDSIPAVNNATSPVMCFFRGTIGTPVSPYVVGDLPPKDAWLELALPVFLAFLGKMVVYEKKKGDVRSVVSVSLMFTRRAA